MFEDYIVNLIYFLIGFVNVGFMLYDFNFIKSWNGNKDII